MITMLSRTWPWYVVGPLIGLFVPALLLLGNRQLGVSSNFRHLCAAIAPGTAEFFRYDWRARGMWNLLFLAGILIGGFLAGHFLASSDVAISARTRADLAAIGIGDVSGLVPRELLSWAALRTVRGFVAVVGGGFLVGFGTAYAGGCVSGHGISGLAALERPSLVAVVGCFAGGLFATYFILPRLF
jgi:uncharacterized membrane protein YedE/YeeE